MALQRSGVTDCATSARHFIAHTAGQFNSIVSFPYDTLIAVHSEIAESRLGLSA